MKTKNNFKPLHTRIANKKEIVVENAEISNDFSFSENCKS